MCWWSCLCWIRVTQLMVYKWLHLDISNQWGCNGEAIILMDVTDSCKDIIEKIENFVLLNCPTRRELIYTINVATQLLCWIDILSSIATWLLQLLPWYELSKIYGEWHCLRGQGMRISTSRLTTRRDILCWNKREYVMIVLH